MKTSFLEYDSLMSLLQEQMADSQFRTAFSFLADGDTVSASQSYGELFSEVKRIAQTLLKQVQVGDRVLVLYPTGLAFVPAFLGCLYVGVIPVVSSFSKQEKSSHRLGAIVDDCEPIMVLSQSSEAGLLNELSMSGNALEELDVLFTDEIDDSDDIEIEPIQTNGKGIAFLQYTSGSTADPRGVVISHQSLLHNLELHRKGMHLGSLSEMDAVFVSWLPHFHQMGLVSVFLLSLGIGATTYFMSPLAFVKKPVRWLRAVSRFKGTIIGAPNFAYDLCCDKVPLEDKASLDLSSLNIAFVSSEPIHSETINGFSRAFEDCAFRKDCFLPAYGQAENTTLITGEKALKTLCVDRHSLGNGWIVPLKECEGGERGIELVSSGPALLGQSLLIVDPKTHTPKPNMHVGEIWLYGASVANGYWKKPELTKAHFQACLKVDSDSLNQNRWLKTGDLGFIHDEHVYITGREKELIIIRGRNLYPQDIERTVTEAHLYLNQGRGAAFSVEKEQREVLVLIQEVMVSGLESKAYSEIAQQVEHRVTGVHQVSIDEIVFVRKNAVPRTTSGKIARVASREDWLKQSVRGELKRVSLGEIHHEDELLLPPDGEDIDLMVLWLVQAFKNFTGLTQIDPSKDLYDLGFDSMKLVDFISYIEEELGQLLPVDRFVFDPTLNHLAVLMCSSEASDGESKEGSS